MRKDADLSMASFVAKFFIVFFLLLAGQTFLLNASRAEEKVRMSVAAVTGSYMDEFVAIEKGYHRDEGLAVEMIRAGGGVATQALIAGDLHFSTSAGSALTAMLRGAEIKVVYTNICLLYTSDAADDYSV